MQTLNKKLFLTGNELLTLKIQGVITEQEYERLYLEFLTAVNTLASKRNRLTPTEIKELYALVA